MMMGRHNRLDNFFSQDQGITFSKDITAEENENNVLYYYYTLFKYIVFKKLMFSSGSRI